MAWFKKMCRCAKKVDKPGDLVLEDEGVGELCATPPPPRESVDDEGQSDDVELVDMEMVLIGYDRQGRVHTAVVSGVNVETSSVTVEWFEKGETKGKEIEMEAIFALNGDLGPKGASNNNHSHNVIPTKVSRYTANPKLNNVAPGKAAPTYRTRQQLRGTMVPPSNGHDAQGRGDAHAHTPARGLENIAPSPSTPMTSSTVTATPSSRQAQLAHIQLQKQQQLQQQQFLFEQQQKQQAAEAAAAAQGAGRGRRSNVVKEVERLKKNREERRQRQAELKEEKEVLMSVDPGNPNWEFLNMIREFQVTLDFRPLRDTDPVEDHQITVCIRKRPLNKKELTRKEVDVITVASKDQLIVHEPRTKVDLKKYLENQQFRFDYAFDDSCSNELVYKFTAQPLVKTIFEGGMATCFAYGQTGSGKTHTMGGVFHGKVQDCKNGIYAMAAKDVFQYLKSPRYKPMNFMVSSSFFEIYSGKVFDLLANKNKLRVLEDGKQQVQIVGLTEKIVDSVEDVLRLIQHGNAARTSGQTAANSNSSRSHAVFQIVIRTPGINKVHGKFSLIDLAGNERGADTLSTNRQTRMEGAEINKSLLALKECIRALGRKGSHLPFRASKLTQVLRDSFIGDKSKTCMIAMISPGLSSCDHSLNTLRYADRVKELAANDLAASNSPSDEEKDRDLNESDLAQLRSLNEGEISAEMFTFHEAVSYLQNLEDEVLDAHKFVVEKAAEWQEIDEDLLNSTRDVDYDQDGETFYPNVCNTHDKTSPRLGNKQFHHLENDTSTSYPAWCSKDNFTRENTAFLWGSKTQMLVDGSKPTGDSDTTQIKSSAIKNSLRRNRCKTYTVKQDASLNVHFRARWSIIMTLAMFLLLPIIYSVAFLSLSSWESGWGILLSCLKGICQL